MFPSEKKARIGKDVLKDERTLQPDYWKNKYVFLLESYNKMLLNELSKDKATTADDRKSVLSGV